MPSSTPPTPSLVATTISSSKLPPPPLLYPLTPTTHPHLGSMASSARPAPCASSRRPGRSEVRSQSHLCRTSRQMRSCILRRSTFDPILDANSLTDETKPAVKPPKHAHVSVDSLARFHPSNLDLTKFAADVEMLLGQGLDDDSFCIEGLGLMDSRENDDKGRVKAELDIDAGGGNDVMACNIDMDQIDLSREMLELDFGCRLPAAGVELEEQKAAGSAAMASGGGGGDQRIGGGTRRAESCRSGSHGIRWWQRRPTNPRRPSLAQHFHQTPSSHHPSAPNSRTSESPRTKQTQWSRTHVGSIDPSPFRCKNQKTKANVCKEKKR